ncbi:Bsp6I family type II restriction endonuclease [Lonepinella sp. BR2357]|uniref:Bsp6I family type II restriction endonuclease n=1 Tax=Lonepinella sp. BR2357 TaxID=3434549 RepID=UPI003F6DF9A0
MDFIKLGRFIKKLRDKNHLTQAELAEKADISINYVGDIENARKSISLEKLSVISKALGFRVDHLLNSFYSNKEDNEMTVEFDSIKDAYHKWKSLNEIISEDMDSRKINLPEAISENIACHALGLTRNMDSSGDATDAYGNLIEIKATSNFNSDLSSFSPDTHFDKLLFVRLNLDTDEAYIYDLCLNGREFGKLQVNKTETVYEHQSQGRRPRLSLVRYIEEKGLKPVKIVSLK